MNEQEQAAGMANDATGDAGKLVTDIIERRNESRKWLKYNFWDELTEVWQGIKCRTSPIYRRDQNGKETKEEDKSKTNVAMPDLNIIWRRNAARVTANPYLLRYEGGDDPFTAARMTALSSKQYDRSDEPEQDVRLVMAAEGFGYGYTKLYYDKLTKNMSFRRALMLGEKVVNRTRADVMQYQGAPQDEINDAVGQLGPEMSDDEIGNIVAKSGKELQVPTEVLRYEGPIVKWIFNGDLFLEPGALTLNASDYAIEQYRESDLWLKKMVKQTYDDGEGNQIPVFDPNAVKELLSADPDLDVRPDELRDLFQGALGKQDQEQYKFPKNLRVRKKFDILEQHALGSDGRMWITWVSENRRDEPLGRMPYPFDLYGKYAYTEYVPLPDLLYSIGDCTPRLLRHLYKMHNATVAQNFDYVTNLLKTLFLKKQGMEITNDVISRDFFRVLEVLDINGLKPLDTPPLPGGAFEREAQILRMMSIAEPSLTTVDSGSESNPQAGKTATTALLASKAADSLTQFKLDSRNRYLRELGRKKLWINQQMGDEPWRLESKYWPTELKDHVEEQTQNGQAPDWAMSDRFGKVSAVRLSWHEIQEDFDVEPEAGSYLAVDDEIRQTAAARVAQIGASAPGIIDMRMVARFALSTVKGIDNPDDFILPAGPQAPPVRLNVTLTGKLEDMPSDIVNQVLPGAGLQPSEELEHRDTLKGVQQLGVAADAAANLAQPVTPPEIRKPGVPGFKGGQ